jgi:Glycoside hydrolase family 44/Bacterial Ig-like domain (group 2)
MRRNSEIFATALMALALGLGGCTEKVVPTDNAQLAIIRQTGVSVSPTAASIAAGATTQLTATALDRRGKLVVSPVFVWTSSNAAIATVSSTGLVTAVSAGTASIRATRSSAYASAAITVTGGVTPPPPPPPPPVVGDVSFSVDAASTFAISRFIYGGNFIDDASVYGGATPPAEMTFNRFGGNRLTAYNWENNYSNAGADYEFRNDQYLSSSTVPGQAVRARATPSFTRNQAFMATVPMLGYVSADACNCNVGTTDAARTTRLASRFRVSRPFKGSAFSLTPNTGDGFVYQDEFVNWFESSFPGRSTNTTAPVFYSLDNEPDIWHSTHKEIQSDIGDNANTPRLQAYAGYADTSVQYARAVKSVAPNAMVFGPATATYAGLVTLGRYPTPDPQYGTQNFFDVYLARMRAAEATYGRRLLDVLDLHFYPAASSGGSEITNDYATQDAAMAEARMQAPRSLWDPTYTENSWVVQVTGGPVRLIPRLRDQIAANYPGTKIAITEYYYGRGGDISGGIAQADVLGVFGREGVYAASLWPIAGLWAAPYGGDGNKAYAFAFGAFRMYRNYDGAGGRFGDTGLRALTSDNAMSSVYASRDDAGNVVLIAINKTGTSKVASIALRNVTGLTKARVYTMTSASATPVRQADLTVNAGATSYAMPAYSVSTIVVTP